MKIRIVIATATTVSARSIVGFAVAEEGSRKTTNTYMTMAPAKMKRTVWMNSRVSSTGFHFRERFYQSSASKVLHLLLVDHRDAQFLRLIQLRARIGPGHYIVCFLAD